MTKTNDELREEIRELLDIPDLAAGNSQFRTPTLEKAVEVLGGTTWGGRPSLRQQLREILDLVEDGEQDGSGLRKKDLIELRDQLEEASVE